MSHAWYGVPEVGIVTETDNEITAVALYEAGEAYEETAKKENRQIDICWFILKWSAIMLYAAGCIRLGYALAAWVSSW
jgi:hypothetical protein